jgi:hypothetical protein
MPMNRNVAHTTQAQTESRWTKVMYDAGSIDSDIEAALDALRKRHGYTRKRARSELLGRLASAAR